MARKHADSPRPDADKQGPPGDPQRRSMYVLFAIIIILCVTNVIAILDVMRVSRPVPGAATLSTGALAPLKDFKVFNAHEHLFSEKYLDKYLDAAAATGVTSTLFVASSEFTLKGEGFDPAKGNDENSAELNRLARQHPGKIVPFCTIHPSDPERLEKVKRFVAEGARGLKLYTGHGNFHERPLDDESVLALYAYCEETRLPICWHVNLLKYAAEFERVMQKFPDLLVIVPHFGVTFWRPESPEFRFFQILLDKYPNLYTDTSFGTREILVGGLENVSRYPEVFRAVFEKYSDRILWGTDMVVTGNREKTTEWIEAVLRACRDVLEKDTYVFFMGARGSLYAQKEANNTYGIYRGLNLPDDILRKVYETNAKKLFPDL